MELGSFNKDRWSPFSLDGLLYSYHDQNLAETQAEISLVEILLRGDKDSLLTLPLARLLWALFLTKASF